MTAPTINFDAICNALAARFTTANMGTPTGAQAMRGSYSELPKNIPTTPWHMLSVQNGTVVANPGQWKHEMQIDGLLILAKRPSDPARVDQQRQLWLPYLLHAAVDHMQLGLGAASGYSVDKAIPTTWEWTEYPIGGDEYDAIRVNWTVYVTETVTLTP